MNATTSPLRRGAAMALVVLLVLSHAPVRVAAQSPGGGTAAGPVDRPWPRQVTSGIYTIRVYQPQLDKWDGTALEARAAVSVEQPSAPQPDFGVAWITARTEVDRVNRLVALDRIQITKASFPGAAGKADWTYLEILRKSLPKGVRTVALDRLQASLAITEAQSRQQKVEPVKNDPPRILFSPSPALLVLVDGKPVLRQVEGSKLLRVINTWALVLVDGSSGQYYLRVLEHWAEASAVEGPWAVSARPPASLETVRQSLAKSQKVNLLDDPGPGLKEAAKQGRYPTIHVSTAPAELIQTDGQPSYEPIGGTELLHVKNSSANILVDQKTGDHYVLLAGRWFRGKSLERGPWEYVDHDKLPPDFAKIPENHPRGAVLASVAGTPQAQEALIDNSIPQTAEVNRQAAKLQAAYDGSPQLKPIEGTPLHHVVNSPIPVIQVDASTYYALQNGVWFVGRSVNGPWAAATSVPAVIYTIPASSPLHYVTYVYVYGSTPTTVVMGYTPGYYGTVVAPTSVVVYGTGYDYPVYAGTVWYPYAPTYYGSGAGFAWGAFTGFVVGAAVGGAIWGGAWGCCRGDVDVDVNRNVNINRSNAYGKWNQGQVKSNLQGRAQGLSGEQRQQAQQRAQARANDVYAGRDGSAYRRGTEGWERSEGGQWSGSGSGTARETTQSLDREQRARSTGESRERSYSQASRSSSVGAGTRGSGGGGGRGGGGGGRRR